MRALLSVTAFAIGCSTSPGDPTLPTGTDGKPTTREFAYGCPQPAPAATNPPATFTAIYDDLLSETTSAAKCQASGCHGGSNGNGELSLGHSKLDAFCGMVAFGLVAPDDCTACSLCDAEKDDTGVCGSSASGHACCHPCPKGGDAGVEAGADAATDAEVVAVPTAVIGLYNIVTPDSKGTISMPRLFCGNRTLAKNETDALAAWGRNGAPFD